MSINGSSNSGKIWSIAAIVGIVAFFALKMLADYSFMPALLLAILIGVLVAILLWIGFYRDTDDDMSGLTGGSGSAAAENPDFTTTKASSSPVVAESASNATPSSTTAETSVAKDAGRALNDEILGKAKAPRKTPTKKKPTAKTTAAAKSEATKAKSPAAKTASAKKSTTKVASAKPTAAETASTAATAKPAAKKAATKAAPARKPVAKDGKPETLKKARAGGADDLKQLKGVGPGLEKTLNELGFFHFDQVAGWRKKEIEWVDSRLKFKGRIERDEWTKQAKTLAKGDATEFSKRVKKGDVY